MESYSFLDLNSLCAGVSSFVVKYPKTIFGER